MKKKENTILVDIKLDAPEGFPGVPETIHFKVDVKAMQFARQYTDMLYVVRKIPFDLSKLTAADPIALMSANQMGLKGDVAVSMARQWYMQWQSEAENDALMLAFLHDNKFEFDPQPYEEEETADEIMFIPAPVKDITNKVEKKLKQINDMVSASPDFNSRLMSSFNNAITDLVGLVEDSPDEDEMGFPATGVDESLPDDDEPPSGDEKPKPRNGRKSKSKDKVD